MPEIGPYYAQDSMYYKTHDQLVADFIECIGPLPTHKIVCPQCDGKGTMVNRSIDGQGITQSDREDWADDDFMEGYWRGDYDVTCDECRGNNVVDAVDYESLSPEMAKEWDAWCKDAYDLVAENLAELRFGA
jgi:hypothetical protein